MEECRKILVKYSTDDKRTGHIEIEIANDGIGPNIRMRQMEILDSYMDSL